MTFDQDTGNLEFQDVDAAFDSVCDQRTKKKYDEAGTQQTTVAVTGQHQAETY